MKTILLDVHENLIESNKFWLIQISFFGWNYQIFQSIWIHKIFCWINQNFIDLI